MPPSISFTKDTMVETAFTLVRAEGLEALSARRLAQALGGSTNPLYREFGGMEELKTAVLARGRDFVQNFLAADLPATMAFYEVGIRYMRLAQEEPVLFKIFFMTEGIKSGMENFDPPFDRVLNAAVQDPCMAGLTPEVQRQCFHDMWVFTHGLITLVHTGVISDDQEKLKLTLARVGWVLLSHREGA